MRAFLKDCAALSAGLISLSVDSVRLNFPSDSCRCQAYKFVSLDDLFLMGGFRSAFFADEGIGYWANEYSLRLLAPRDTAFDMPVSVCREELHLCCSVFMLVSLSSSETLSSSTSWMPAVENLNALAFMLESCCGGKDACAPPELSFFGLSF